MSCRKCAMRADEDVILDGHRAVDITVQTDENMTADGAFVRHANNCTRSNQYLPAAKAQQFTAQCVIRTVVRFVAIFGKLSKQLVADIDLWHMDFSP